MADEYYSDNQPRLIHCDNCGEDYAATYRACPFCHTGPDGKKVASRSSGSRSSRAGNRVRTNTRGGGYGGPRSPLSIVGIVLAVVLIVAAIVIVIVLAKSLFSGGDKDGQQPASTPSSSITSQEEPGGNTDEPSQPVPPDGVSLDQTELTLTAGTTATLVASIDPVNWIGQVIWSTSDANIATVDQSGVVTFVNEGTCTISASAAGVTASCNVTCAGAGEPAEPQQPTQSSLIVKSYGRVVDDVSIKIGEEVYFKVEGGDGANYNWSVADASIASVDATGKLVGLGEGKTTMTVTSGGESTEVTIRVKS